jgi:hypothetical protein
MSPFNRERICEACHSLYQFCAGVEVPGFDFPIDHIPIGDRQALSDAALFP